MWAELVPKSPELVGLKLKNIEPQVMDANLLLFKTVIAGDSWGEIAVPVIQEHPATAIIFASWNEQILDSYITQYGAAFQISSILTI